MVLPFVVPWTANKCRTQVRKLKRDEVVVEENLTHYFAVTEMDVKARTAVVEHCKTNSSARVQVGYTLAYLGTTLPYFWQNPLYDGEIQRNLMVAMTKWFVKKEHIFTKATRAIRFLVPRVDGQLRSQDRSANCPVNVAFRPLVKQRKVVRGVNMRSWLSSPNIEFKEDTSLYTKDMYMEALKKYEESSKLEEVDSVFSKKVKIM